MAGRRSARGRRRLLLLLLVLVLAVMLLLLLLRCRLDVNRLGCGWPPLSGAGIGE